MGNKTVACPVSPSKVQDAGQVDQLLEAYLTGKRKADDEMIGFLVETTQAVHIGRLQIAEQIKQLQTQLENLARQHTGLVAQEKGYLADIRKWLGRDTKNKKNTMEETHARDR